MPFIIIPIFMGKKHFCKLLVPTGNLEIALLKVITSTLGTACLQSYLIAFIIIHYYY